MRNDKNAICVYFKEFEDCYCNNPPDDPGECIYENGIEPKTPELCCPYYKPLKERSVTANKLTEIARRETGLFNLYGGHIPEANAELNDLQREKIAAIYEGNGNAYIGKINYYSTDREALTVDTVFTEYTGQKVFNFDADFIVPVADRDLAEMIVQWNSGNPPVSLTLINRICKRVTGLRGANLIWS